MSNLSRNCKFDLVSVLFVPHHKDDHSYKTDNFTYNDVLQKIDSISKPKLRYRPIPIKMPMEKMMHVYSKMKGLL